jgi:multidrug efflux pump subunit AcrB
LLTTLTTFFGIAPLIFETSLQAQFLIPTAVSLGIGLLVGSLFVLFLVPALCAVWSRIFDPQPQETGAVAGTDPAG